MAARLVSAVAWGLAAPKGTEKTMPARSYRLFRLGLIALLAAASLPRLAIAAPLNPANFPSLGDQSLYPIRHVHRGHQHEP